MLYRQRGKQNRESRQTENLLQGISGQVLAGESARWRGQHSLGCYGTGHPGTRTRLLLPGGMRGSARPAAAEIDGTLLSSMPTSTSTLRGASSPASLAGRGEGAACFSQGPRSSTALCQTVAVGSWSPSTRHTKLETWADPTFLPCRASTESISRAGGGHRERQS